MFKDFALLKGYEFVDKQGDIPRKIDVHPDYEESYMNKLVESID